MTVIINGTTGIDTVQDDSVDIPTLSATGTPSSSTYLRGDNSWASIASSQWTTTGSDIYYNTGNVGIGNSSPSKRLHVTLNNASDYAVCRISNSGSTATIDMGVGGSSVGGSLANNAYLYNTGNSAFVFGTNDTERMRINADGSITGNFLGSGQTLQNLTSSRSLSTNYTNTTGKPIFVTVMGNTGNPIIYVGGTATQTTVSGQRSCSMIVPNGSVYYATVNTGSLLYWSELR